MSSSANALSSVRGGFGIARMGGTELWVAGRVPGFGPAGAGSGLSLGFSLLGPGASAGLGTGPAAGATVVPPGLAVGGGGVRTGSEPGAIGCVLRARATGATEREAEDIEGGGAIGLTSVAARALGTSSQPDWPPAEEPAAGHNCVVWTSHGGRTPVRSAVTQQEEQSRQTMALRDSGTGSRSPAGWRATPR